VIDLRDVGAGRSLAAFFDHGVDRIVLADENGLHRTVAAIAYPAFEAAAERPVFGPGAKTDALNTPADNDMAKCAQPNSPNFGCPAASAPFGSHSCREEM
jgi:hypothetical protein